MGLKEELIDNPEEPCRSASEVIIVLVLATLYSKLQILKSTRKC